MTSFNLRRCDSAKGSSTADESGTHAASLDSSSIFNSASISAAYTVNSDFRGNVHWHFVISGRHFYKEDLGVRRGLLSIHNARFDHIEVTLLKHMLFSRGHVEIRGYPDVMN
jgi:hypothetical protein